MSDRLRCSRPIDVLLVEDNENDVILTREAFKQTKVLLNLHHVENGQQCLAFLRQQAPYANAPVPDLVLLDLKMPVMDGREVLTELVADPGINHIPVVVLTTSADEQDVLQMYKLGANSYVSKPVDFDQFVRVIQGISEYWFTVVTLPSRGRSAGNVEARPRAQGPP